MRIISKKPLREFCAIHPEAKPPLNHWFRIVSKTSFESFGDIRKTFPSADWVKGLVVFNIGGNKYRLVAAVHFNTQKMYIRHVLTHDDYDRVKWNERTRPPLRIVGQ
ncbi:MAG: type II toxin-antitoxin system HigB family toxin [bacterium]